MQKVFSGVAPSGVIHLGNYLGAIKNWVEMQNDHQCVFCVVDLHAITVPQNPAELTKKTLEVAKIYLAAGLDPAKSIIFIQSQVKEHAELAWILNIITRMSDLFRMTQFKDKAKIDFDRTITEIKKRILYAGETQVVSTETSGLLEDLFSGLNKSGVGLFDYPVLMAADILLYNTNVVPVGEDQIQHVELARDLAQRFNNRFGETFIIPKAVVKKEGARIMGLDDPAKKMSKSAGSAYNYIALTDEPDLIREKIKKAVTDSGKEIVFSDDKPALANLLTIYSLCAGKTIKDIEKEYQGRGYADFKNGLAEAIITFLAAFQANYAELDEDYLLKVLKDGAERAQAIASQTMAGVKKAIGLIN